VQASIDTKVNYFDEKDLNNNYFVFFVLNKILYFHFQVNKGVGLIMSEIGLKNRQIINEMHSFRCFLIL
jgi:hypothetical protein